MGLFDHAVILGASALDAKPWPSVPSERGLRTGISGTSLVPEPIQGSVVSSIP